jgi:hypothetical protein
MKIAPSTGRCLRWVALAVAAGFAGGCGVGDLPAGARVSKGNPPCVLGVPEVVDVGAVPPGIRVPVKVEARNQRPDTACRIDSMRLEACAPGFALESTGPLDLGPGGTAPVSLTFQGEEGPPRTCELVFGLGTEQPERRVALRAQVSSSCLEVTPEVRFPGAFDGCPQASSITIFSTCGPELVLAGITTTSPAFQVVDPPPFPVVIPRLEERVLTVGFVPVASGNETGLLLLQFEGATAPVTVDLWGYGSVPRPDVFQQTPKPKVDLLVVLENASSMTHNQHAAGNLEQLPSYLAAQHADFHLGVTTTGLDPGGYCPGGVGGGEDGRLFPVVGNRPRWIDPDTEDPTEAFAANLAVGACRTGPSQPFEAAVRALGPPVIDHDDDPRHPEPHDGNLGFLREDAELRLLFVTDHEDESPLTPLEYRSALGGLKPPGKVSFYAFAGEPGEGCSGPSGRAEPADRLHLLATAGGPGFFASLCQRDWEEDLRDVAAVPVSFQTCFFLGREPGDRNGNGAVDERDFEVQVNGEEVPPVAANGVVLWTYQDDVNAICFQPQAVPELGSEVVVDYGNRCE